MSCNWNLSDDEEDLEEWTEKQAVLSSKETAKPEAAVAVSPSPFAAARSKDGSTSEEEEDVDWEDAEEEDDLNDDDDDRKPSPSTDAVVAKLRPVSIDMNKDEEEEGKRKKMRKRKRRNKFRVHSLPGFLQDQLWNLHRSHLLSLTSRAVFLSHLCSDSEVSAVALSLVPTKWNFDSPPPSVAQLCNFLQKWYFELVHTVEARRDRQLRANLAAGAPGRRRRGSNKQQRREQQNAVVSDLATSSLSTQEGLLAYMSYLSTTNDENPQLAETFVATPLLKIQLLIAMARSMGWRARFVQAMDPMTPDLDVQHPLMTSLGNILLGGKQKKQSAKKRKTSNDTRKKGDDEMTTITSTVDDDSQLGENSMGWVEILCHDKTAKSKMRWIHVDPNHNLVDEPDQVEILLARQQQSAHSKKRSVLAYVLAVEHCVVGEDDSAATGGGEAQVTRFRLTDVTPRYAQSWIASLQKRGVVRSKKCSIEENVKASWWSKTVHEINNNDSRRSSTPPVLNDAKSGASKEDAIVLDDDSDNDKKPAAVEKVSTADDHFDDADHEAEELKESANNEAIPTSKAAFQKHPLYVLPSLLGNAEVLAPDASKRVCGVFKGQLVYRRSDVSTALSFKKWLYRGRKVLKAELSKPIKRVKARKKPASAGFKALQSYGVGEKNDGSEERREQDIAAASKELEDGMENLYAKWQTEAWSPAPVGPTDEIPVNEYKNVELALLNPGLAHIDRKGMAVVAKKLSIPYAPCLLGFEGHGGNRTPTIRGIVVHQHNEQLLLEASVEVTSHAIQQDHEDRRKAIRLRWKKLMVGLLTKARLDREYGEMEDESE